MRSPNILQYCFENTIEFLSRGDFRKVEDHSQPDMYLYPLETQLMVSAALCLVYQQKPRQSPSTSESKTVKSSKGHVVKSKD